MEDSLAVDSNLIIVIDAPKHDVDKIPVQEVLAFCYSIKNFKSVEVIAREFNYGVAKSIASGVSLILEKYEFVIVFEDDLVVRPGILKFFNESLKKYQLEEKVYQISGYMYPVSAGDEAPCFLPLISCWGWATWRRAWKFFNFSLEGEKELKDNRILRHEFNLQGSYDYYGMISQQRRGEINSWGICWYLNVFLRKGVVLFPGESFIQNIGVDSSGTHGSGHSMLQQKFQIKNSLKSELKYPIEVKVDHVMLSKVIKTVAGLKHNFIKEKLMILFSFLRKRIR